LDDLLIDLKLPPDALEMPVPRYNFTRNSITNSFAIARYFRERNKVIEDEKLAEADEV